MERRVQRSLSHRQGVARQDLNALRDSPPVQRLARDGLEDQQIESALEQVGRFRHRYLDDRQSYLDYRQQSTRGWCVDVLRVTCALGSVSGETLDNRAHVWSRSPRERIDAVLSHDRRSQRERGTTRI